MVKKYLFFLLILIGFYTKGQNKLEILAPYSQNVLITGLAFTEDE